MKAILTYHSIDESASVISVSASTFAAHMSWLAEHIAVVPVEDITTTSAVDAVAITFDDGFQNFADVALPVLRDHGLPATVFVATNYLGKTNGWAAGAASNVPELPLMSWDTLEAISKYGVTIGSHTKSHPDLRCLSAVQQETEIAEAAMIIGDRLGKRPVSFAYPFGELDDSSVRAVRDTYRYACTTELRALERADDPCLLPRLDAYYLRRAGMLEQFGAPAFRRFLWVRRHGRAVKRVLAHAGGRA
jgi:peptidoglycan/xylan/chitin deacetylase (PgdA/CDA1 family)